LAGEIAVDVVFGSIPLLRSVFGQANRRNLRIFQEHECEKSRRAGRKCADLKNVWEHDPLMRRT
jgi:hypothetical protein